MSDTKLLGRWGEAEAARHLREKGFRVVAAGYRTRFGEIDLIAEDGKYIAFVEVKLRRDERFAMAREFVTPQKREKIRSTAMLWLQQHPTELQPRFDVVEVIAPEGTRTISPRIEHIDNAFE